MNPQEILQAFLMKLLAKPIILSIMLGLLTCQQSFAHQPKQNTQQINISSEQQGRQLMQEFVNAYQAQDWDKTDQIVTRITRQYLQQQDSQGLVLFWQNFLKQQSSHLEYEYVLGLVKNTDDFRQDVRQLLQQGIKKHQQNSAIKAFYYEYFYDGSDESTGNLFLCLDFNKDDGEWASNFEDLVNGGLIRQYFADYDKFSSDISESIAKNYTHAVLQDIFMQEVRNNPLPIPVGFADHENNYRMVIILPNSSDVTVYAAY